MRVDHLARDESATVESIPCGGMFEFAFARSFINLVRGGSVKVEPFERWCIPWRG